MKKIWICLLCIFIAVFSGCQQSPHNQNQSKTQKILIIGNSHSVDAFYLLYQAYKDQYPNKKIVLGVLYYSGCSISKHVEFAKNDEAPYRYYKNTDGMWNIQSKFSMKTVLQDQAWDIVMLQAAKSDLDDTLNLNGRRELEEYVNQHVTNPHNFIWHTSWPSPNDERFFSADWVKQPPEGYKQRLINLYGFDPVNQYTVLANMAKNHILNDETYSKAICTGTSIMHAYMSGSCSQMDLWRDYTHLNDLGRLVAAYSIVSQLTNQPLVKIGIDKIPTELRHQQYKQYGDLIITDTIKDIVIKSANYALNEPFGILTQEQ